MSAINDHITRIHAKLQQLVKDHNHLQKEKEGLCKTIHELKVKLDQDKMNVEALQQQVNILKASAGNMHEADKKEFERRIGQYIKQIDKSIELLSE
jgi:chromosome segregation ATPase